MKILSIVSNKKTINITHKDFRKFYSLLVFLFHAGVRIMNAVSPIEVMVTVGTGKILDVGEIRNATGF